ncbi:hypothetical protein QBC32DRAFT_38850 [Pseudoneurospora amorphoporcata]|uniref:Uncharacterized protein n=1 Tax=Pseudoneurospora amorphoporcata TaxID=241081 RepID=A0AAN6P4E4_9PEZI|nr:hypothetical protein QBC32DRAFT_38850 [Pseudoneurospora amorphoporcata]
MSYQPDSALLRRPVELRLQIYEYAWTIPYEKKFFIPRCSSKLKATYLEAQLSAICTLGAICRTIREEAYSEYFHVTQIFLGWGHTNRRPFVDMALELHLQDNDRKAREVIQSSYLLKTQARHVCLRWEHNLEITMTCLTARIENTIITLDVVCDASWFDHCIEMGDWGAVGEKVNEIAASYYDDRHSERVRSFWFMFPHGILKKAVVRTCLTDPNAVNRFVEEDSVGFQRFKRDVATLVSPRKEEQEERPYRFKNHIGALDLHWPRVDRI